MDKRNRSNSILDPDSKLEQYKKINQELTQGIASLRTRVKHLNNEIVSSRSENLKWQAKYMSLKRMFVEHIQSITVQIQSNAEKLNELSDLSDLNDVTEMVDTTKNQSSTNPTSANANVNVDVSRRLSKSFEQPKVNTNLSGDPSDELLMTIVEDSEDGSILEVESCRRNGESDDDSSKDDDSSVVEREEESQVSSDEHSHVNSKEESHVNSDEESHVNSDDDSHVSSNEESQVSSENESHVNSDEDSHVNSNEASQVSSESESQLENDDESQLENEEESTDDNSDGNDQGSKDENRSKNSPERSEQGSDTENDDDDIEKISLVTTSNESTITNTNFNKENDSSVAVSPSIISINEVSQSMSNVNGQSLQKSTVRLTPTQLPLKEKCVNSRVAHLQLESTGNKFLETMKKRDVASSTPYKYQDLSNNSKMDIEKSNTSGLSGPDTSTNQTSQDLSNTVISPRPRVAVTTRSSRSSTVDTMESSISTRPKRRASPINYSEPKLNTKLRRPR